MSHDIPTPEQLHDAGLHADRPSLGCMHCVAPAGTPPLKAAMMATDLLDAERRRGIEIMLRAIGEDPTREGLRDTPRRVVKAWQELTSGIGQDPQKLLTAFDAEGWSGMVAVGPVEFYSTCEHHLLPFFGKAWVAYIPRKKIIGLSKMPRLVEMFSRRLQNQERLTKQIGDALSQLCQTPDVAVVLKGMHMCSMARGARQSDAVMTTPYLRGAFFDQPSTRAEFYSLSTKE